MAELYYESFDAKDLKELLNIIFTDNEIKNCIYEETINILKNKYNLNIDDIKI